MNCLNEKCWLRLLPIDNTPLLCEGGFPINGLALTELMEAVHQKNADFRFRARGYSMYPAIRDGDVITISPIREIRPVPGDVAAYLHPFTGKLVVHRLCDFKEGFFLGAGDNIDGHDGWISIDNLLGVVTDIERNGQKINWNRHLSRMSISDRLQRYCTLTIYIKKNLITFGQSPCVKAILKKIIRPLIRSELAPAAYFLIDYPHDKEQGIKNISIDLYFLKWHAARMEFNGLSDDMNQIQWWLSGSGTHPFFQDLGLEFEIFRKAKNILLNAGIYSVRVNIPGEIIDIQHFYDNLGFIEEKRIYSDANHFSRPKGMRVILKCAFNRGEL